MFGTNVAPDDEDHGPVTEHADAHGSESPHLDSEVIAVSPVADNNSEPRPVDVEVKRTTRWVLNICAEGLFPGFGYRIVAALVRSHRQSSELRDIHAGYVISVCEVCCSWLSPLHWPSNQRA